MRETGTLSRPRFLRSVDRKTALVTLLNPNLASYVRHTFEEDFLVSKDQNSVITTKKSKKNYLNAGKKEEI